MQVNVQDQPKTNLSLLSQAVEHMAEYMRTLFEENCDQDPRDGTWWLNGELFSTKRAVYDIFMEDLLKIAEARGEEVRCVV